MQIQKLRGLKSQMTEKQKRKLLFGLRNFKEGLIGANNTDISNADNLQVNEDEYTARISPERNVIAKQFEIDNIDYQSYVNQRRGLEITPKEFDSVTNYTSAKPVQTDRYFIKYEIADEFNTNTTTIIKKLKEDGKLCWTAFSKYASSNDEGKPTDPNSDASGDDVEEQHKIRITKTVTFIDDIESSNVLADLLIKLDL